MNPAAGAFKGGPRSRYLVSHDISRFERSDAARLQSRRAKGDAFIIRHYSPRRQSPEGWTLAAEGLRIARSLF
jgi:hypothetical protein